MSDTTIARTVEEANLQSMRDMNIDDVYTLMDVQLRDRPSARDLYKRWEKQNWAAFEIDFTKDKEDWAVLGDEVKQQFLGAMYAFFLGESAVTDTLSPMVHAAPTDEDRQFLSTQLVDEARHTIFFERFFREVMGVDGLAAARAEPEIQGFLFDAAERGYARLFYVDLPNVTDAVRKDPSDYGLWIDSICIYHMLIEGMLALYGQRFILQGARAFNILPGFRAGFTAVTRDESRHVNYAVYALRKAVEAGYHDRIVETVSRYMENACAVLTRQTERMEIASEVEMAELPPELNQGTLAEQWSFPTMQLRKRLRQAGIRPDALDRLEAEWWDHVDRNVAEYESLVGEPHPALGQSDWSRRREPRRELAEA
jgi:ribonucleoside-diphosphate reductase beta chain